jgi:hypothetical protein
MEKQRRFLCGHCKRFKRENLIEWEKYCPISGWTVTPLHLNCRKGESDTKEWKPRRPKPRRIVRFG